MSNPPPSSPPPQPRFNPDAPHHQRPKLRNVRGFPIQGQGPDGKPVPLLGLADARQISEKVIGLPPGAELFLPLLDGAHTLDEVVTQVGRGLTRQYLEQVVAQLDDAALIEGPGFESLFQQFKEGFDSNSTLPPAATAQFVDALTRQILGEKATPEQQAAEGPKRIRELFDNWIKQSLKDSKAPPLSALPKAIMVPHVDYPRGWMNYASVYGRLRPCPRPDRVVILGTNHFGFSTGVCGCNKGYESPLGVCEADAQLVEMLGSRLGDKLFEHRYDHENEHSIELQILWIQHIFGKDSAGSYPRVFGALVHDPSVNNGEAYDGNGIGIQPFTEALRDVVASLPGRTLFVSSADLSHAGPAFGDPKPLAGETPEAKAARDKIVQHDREMLELIAGNKPHELVSSMAWQQNPTRWCSIGNIVATMLAAQPTKVELLNYVAAMDQQGMTLVSSAGALMN